MFYDNLKKLFLFYFNSLKGVNIKISKKIF